jgi:hypothetical protein
VRAITGALGPAADAHTHDGQHDERPHQIELLFDGQRPRVQQRRGLPGGGEVVRVLGDQMPIGGIKDGGHGVAQQLRTAQHHGPHGGDDTNDREHEEERREQSTGASGPEPAEGDTASFVPFGHEE